MLIPVTSRSHSRLGSPLLTPPVERALLRALSGDTQDRYKDATSFMEHLAAPLNTPSSMTARSTPPPPPMAAAPPPGGESRRRLITVAVIVTALAIPGSLALLLRGGEPSRPIGAGRTPGADGSPVAASSGSSSASGGSPVAGSPVTGGTGAGAAASSGSAASGAAAEAAASLASDATPTRPPALQVVVSTPDNIQS